MHVSLITDERGRHYRAESTHGHECGTCRAAEQSALTHLRVLGSKKCSYGDTGNCKAVVERTSEDEQRRIDAARAQAVRDDGALRHRETEGSRLARARERARIVADSKRKDDIAREGRIADKLGTMYGSDAR